MPTASTLYRELLAGSDSRSGDDNDAIKGFPLSRLDYRGGNGCNEITPALQSRLNQAHYASFAGAVADDGICFIQQSPIRY